MKRDYESAVRNAISLGGDSDTIAAITRSIAEAYYKEVPYEIKEFSSRNPIQISVYEDKIYIWNDGEMPANLDLTEKLFAKHSSKPYNPKLVMSMMHHCRNMISHRLALWFENM